MSEPTDDGGAAFPQLAVEAVERDGHGDLVEVGRWLRRGRAHAAESAPFTSARGGMSLRDWFAGRALTGIMFRSLLSPDDARTAASLAFALADAMLAERNRRAKAGRTHDDLPWSLTP